MKEILRYYRPRVLRHGNDVRSLAWGSRRSQEERFRIFTELFPLSGARVIDVGCGLGDLLSYLKRRRIRVAYTGIDVVPEMTARARANHPAADFITGDPRRLDLAALRPDYVLASGIFNLRHPGHGRVMWGTIRAMTAAARKGAAFNVMSTAAPRHLPLFHYADPGRCLRRCRALCPRAVLRHDYLPHDFTIALYTGGR